MLSTAIYGYQADLKIRLRLNFIPGRREGFANLFRISVMTHNEIPADSSPDGTHILWELSSESMYKSRLVTIFLKLHNLNCIPKNQRQVRLAGPVIRIWHYLNAEHLET